MDWISLHQSANVDATYMFHRRKYRSAKCLRGEKQALEGAQWVGAEEPADADEADTRTTGRSVGPSGER